MGREQRAYAPQCHADNSSCPFGMIRRREWVRRNLSSYREVHSSSLLLVGDWTTALQINVLCLSAGSSLQTDSGCYHPRGCELFQGLSFLPRNLTKFHIVIECPYESLLCTILSARPGRLRRSGRDAGEVTHSLCLRVSIGPGRGLVTRQPQPGLRDLQLEPSAG